MKNKKNTIFLVVVVLFVWGFLSYKIYLVINPQDEAIQIESVKTVFKPNEIKEMEKFTINLNYRDPFLGKLITENTNKQPNKKKAVVVEFPQIIYKGMLSTKKTNKSATVFFVTINNVEHFLATGEQIEGIKLLKGNKSDITVSFKNVIKIIPIQL